jgi:site-specific DNA-methyltransferase (adenine-specific)
VKPYYQDDAVTIYHGDCREVDAWDIAGGVMVTDPPYGRDWSQGGLHQGRSKGRDAHDGIANDEDTTARDDALRVWGDRPALVFGDLMLPPPPGTRQVLVYRKPPNAGTRGAMAGFRRDAEAVYVMGAGWPSGLGGKSSIIPTREPSQGNPSSPQGMWHHPHAKPEDAMGHLLAAVPPLADVVDPFMGIGTTLRVAKNMGFSAIGVELEESYCEIAAKRMCQEVFDFGGAA